MQRRMADTQRSLGERILEGSAGGGAVKAYVNGNQELQAVRIQKAAVDPTDVETLEDLVTGAVKQALAAAKELRDREMAKVTGGHGTCPEWASKRGPPGRVLLSSTCRVRPAEARWQTAIARSRT